MYQAISETRTVAELLASARAEIRRFTPEEARDATGEGALLIDIRPLEQRLRDGLLPGARLVDRNVLEWRLDPSCPHRDRSLTRGDEPVILICDEGYQSSLAAAVLGKLGVAAGDVIGGVQAWNGDGLELEPLVGCDDMNRGEGSAFQSFDRGYGPSQ
jgi:rhodanese-related sulfurtransferase